jgi:hypothetical protein
VDPETHAMAELARRAKFVRMAVALPLLLTGLALGVVGYWVLRAVFFATVGWQVPYVTGVLTIFPALAISWKAAAAGGRALVTWRAPAWADDIGRTYGVPAHTLAHFARML